MDFPFRERHIDSKGYTPHLINDCKTKKEKQQLIEELVKESRGLSKNHPRYTLIIKELYDFYKTVVYHFYKKYSTSRRDLRDKEILMSEGFDAIYLALDSYKENKGASFFTYVYRGIWNKSITALRKEVKEAKVAPINHSNLLSKEQREDYPLSKPTEYTMESLKQQSLQDDICEEERKRFTKWKIFRSLGEYLGLRPYLYYVLTRHIFGQKKTKAQVLTSLKLTKQDAETFEKKIAKVLPKILKTLD